MFSENIGNYLSIDETAFSNGDLYTIVTNKKAKGKKGALVAMVNGTRADTVIGILHKIQSEQRKKVKEVTLDMAGNMGLIYQKNSWRVQSNLFLRKMDNLKQSLVPFDNNQVERDLE